MTQPQSGRGHFIKATFLFLVLSVAVVLGGTLLYLFRGSSDGPSVDLLIARGASLSSVCNQLEEQAILKSPEAFKVLLRLTGGSAKVRAGEFRFTKNMAPFYVLRTLYFSQPIRHPVTIPEGWTIRDIAQVLAEKKLIQKSKFVSLAFSEKTVRRYQLKAPSMEGFLFPDTYFISKTDTEQQILDQMAQRFFQTYKKYEREAKEKGFSVERLVTFASIVEKETGTSEERPIIASVFHNRIKKRMRLQSDPTTIYGIKDFDGNLTKKHLRTYTPYNTYRINGLPPGPIASPGELSIRATLRPATTDYLYFVSNNQGSHTFSKTYKEHRRKVNYYQKGPGRWRRSQR